MWCGDKKRSDIISHRIQEFLLFWEFGIRLNRPVCRFLRFLQPPPLPLLYENYDKIQLFDIYKKSKEVKGGSRQKIDVWREFLVS